MRFSLLGVILCFGVLNLYILGKGAGLRLSLVLSDETTALTHYFKSSLSPVVKGFEIDLFLSIHVQFHSLGLFLSRAFIFDRSNAVRPHFSCFTYILIWKVNDILGWIRLLSVNFLDAVLSSLLFIGFRNLRLDGKYYKFKILKYKINEK